MHRMVRGHCAYYGVTGNIFAITRFAELAKNLVFKWLNRRGGHKPMTWEKLSKMEKRLPFPRPRISVNMFEKKTPFKQGRLPKF